MKKLLLCGLDGVDWRLLNPLLDSGAMPHLSALAGRGAMGDLYHDPPFVSTLRWTTIATGMPPECHGVLADTEADPRGAGRRPASVDSRRCPAIWRLVEQHGGRSHVVGWPASHPAETLRGVAVGNLFAWPGAPPGAPWPILPDSVSPAKVASSLAGLRIHPADLTANDLRYFVPKLAEIDQRTDTRLMPIAGALAETITFHGAATWILEHEEWNLLAVHYPLIGRLASRYLRYAPPGLQGIPARDTEWFGGVVEAACRFADSLLGRLLQLAGPDALAMLVSAHGVLSGAARPPAVSASGPDFWPRPHGLFCLAGPGIQKDALLYGAGALDIAPTVLACLELPASVDMPGRVLAEAFDTPPSLHRIETPDPISEKPVDEPSMEEAIRALEAMGYADPMAANQAGEERQSAKQRDVHLAWVHLAAGRGGAAVELLTPHLDTPRDRELLGPYLAYAYLLCGRVEDCRNTLDSLPKEDAPAMVHLIRGRMLFGEGREAEALRALEAVARTDRAAPQALSMAGDICRAAHRLEEAARYYDAALKQDADLPQAYLGRALLLLALHDGRSAVDAALQAIRLRYDIPSAHVALGLGLSLLGMEDAAAAAFAACLRMEPGNIVARRRLAASERRNAARQPQPSGPSR